MTSEANAVGANRAFKTLVGESKAGQWASLIVRNWGFFYVALVFLAIWLPSRASPAGLQVLLWIASYTIYLIVLEVLGKLAKRSYDSALFRLFRIHFNLAMITILTLLAPPIASSYLWFFFSMPLLVTVGYFGSSPLLLIIYLEICVGTLVMVLPQGWPSLLDLATIAAKDAILGLLAVVLYFFVHLFPRLREGNTLLDTATTLIKNLDQRELCQLLADAAKAGIPTSDGAVVHLLGGGENQTLVPTGSSHLDLSTLGQSLMRIGVGIAGQAAQSRETINVPDVDKDRRYHHLPSSFIPFKSLLVAPMYVGEKKSVGTISVHSTKSSAFSKRDERFLATLAAQGATAIANAELYDIRTRRRQQISDILQASRAFSLHQSLDALLATIAMEVCHCSGYRMAVVNLLDETSNEIVVKAMAGLPPEGQQALQGVRIPSNIVMSLLLEEFRIGQSYFIRGERCPQIADLGRYTFTPDLGKRKSGEWQQEDMLIIPIQAQEEKLLGYFSVDDPVDRQLPSLDTVQALEILASVAATAIQNACLFEQAQREISERRQAQESLAQEQRLLRTFMDNVPDHIYFKDTDSRFIRINKAMARWFSLGDPAQAIGKTDFDIFTGEHAQQAYTDEQEVMRTGQSISKEEKETWPDGRETWVVTTKMPLRDEGGNIIGTFGISKDITERKSVEDALQQRNLELELLNRVGQALSSTLDLDHLIATVLEEVHHLLGVAACSAWLVDPQTGDLVCQQTTDPRGKSVHGWHLAPSQGLAGWVAQHGESLNVPDVEADSRHFKGVDQQTGLPLRSILTVPLRVKRGVIGVIQVVDTTVGRFTVDDLSLVESLASTAAIAIDNARLYEEANKVRVFNENIVQSMEEGVLLEDANGYITFVNRKTAELLDYSSQELMGKHYTAIIAPEKLAKVKEEAAKRPQGIANRYETLLLTKEGQQVPAIVSAKPLFDQGSFVGVLAVYTDITDIKRQETRLQEYLSSVTSNLALHTNREGLYEFIIVAATKLLPARDCLLFINSEGDNDTLELAATTVAYSTDKPRIAISTMPGCGMVAYVAATRKPVRLAGPEIIGHPAWNDELWRGLGWDSVGTGHSLLAVPMCLPDGQLVGVLAARDAEASDGFSEFDEILLKTLATNAAADIERIVKGLERMRKEAVDAERTRLATDLHDAMNVLATGVRWEAELLLDALEDSDPDAAHVALARLKAALDRGYRDLRYLLEDLRDPTLEQEGLHAALKKRAELIGHGRITTLGDVWDRLPPKVEGALYRVGQEAMDNAVKHSSVLQGTDVKIEIWLEKSDEQARLYVRDDGIGFDVDAPRTPLSHKWGLRRLRDMLRDKGMGGDLKIISAPGKGTTVCATVSLLEGDHGQ
jgi:PAS domain S-box-containing protein